MPELVEMNGITVHVQQYTRSADRYVHLEGLSEMPVLHADILLNIHVCAIH
jgi:hypothetical protein